MGRKFAAIVCIAALAMGATACSGSTEDAAPDKPIQSITDNKRELSFTHELRDESGNLIVTLVTNYTTDYDVTQWHITDTKTLRFSITIKGGQGAAPPIMMIDNTHADVSLQASKAGLDGLAQDTMDDRLHTGTQPGFLLTIEHPYEDLFSIEGFSESLISGWGFMVSGSGSSEITQERLTERHLLDNGVNANKFTFVYDVLIQDPATGLYYKQVIADEFAVKVYGSTS